MEVLQREADVKWRHPCGIPIANSGRRSPSHRYIHALPVNQSLCFTLLVPILTRVWSYTPVAEAIGPTTPRRSSHFVPIYDR